jgi:hypothetical protein
LDDIRTLYVADMVRREREEMKREKGGKRREEGEERVEVAAWDVLEDHAEGWNWTPRSWTIRAVDVAEGEGRVRREGRNEKRGING